MTTTYAKLGRLTPSGTMHAVRTETLDSWDGPLSYCGERVRATFQRLHGQETQCEPCRTALGLVTLRRPARRFAPRKPADGWRQIN
jgi:hypothetical protein